MLRKLVKHAIDRFNQYRRDNQMEGTQLPLDGDPKADQANLVIYRNVAAQFDVELDESDPETPTAWGTVAKMRGFDARIREIVAAGTYFGTVTLRFADDMLPDAEQGLDVDGSRRLLKRWPVEITWTSPTTCVVRGRWCDVQSAVAAMKLAAKSNPSTDVGEQW